MSVLSIPDTNLVRGSSSENFTIIMRESDVVDSLVMASVSQLRSQCGRVHPIDVRLRSSTEEVSIVSCKRKRCDCSHNLSFFDQLHILNRNTSQFSLSSSNQQISVRKDLDS